MSLWKLEWLRLWRTKRWLVLFSAFVLFGFIGPFMARYMAELVGNAGGNITIIVPPPVPADGFTNYIDNAMQIGFVAAIVIAASALAIDTKAGLAVFYKTRITRARDLLLPRYTVVTIATIAAFIVGALVTWYETAVLLGGVPVGKLFAGVLYTCVYLAFACAVVAIAATMARSVLGTVGVALCVLLALPILGIVHPLDEWLPSALVGSLDALLRGEQATHYLRSLAVTVLTSAAALGVALNRVHKRELRP